MGFIATYGAPRHAWASGEVELVDGWVVNDESKSWYYNGDPYEWVSPIQAAEQPNGDVVVMGYAITTDTDAGYDHSGALRCYDGTTGALKWTKTTADLGIRATTGGRHQLKKITINPANGHIYMVTAPGTALASQQAVFHLTAAGVVIDVDVTNDPTFEGFTDCDFQGGHLYVSGEAWASGGGTVGIVRRYNDDLSGATDLINSSGELLYGAAVDGATETIYAYNAVGSPLHVQVRNNTGGFVEVWEHAGKSAFPSSHAMGLSSGGRYLHVAHGRVWCLAHCSTVPGAASEEAGGSGEYWLHKYSFAPNASLEQAWLLKGLITPAGIPDQLAPCANGDWLAIDANDTTYGTPIPHYTPATVHIRRLRLH